MELVMELGNLRKERVSWEQIVRGYMVLAMIVMLCIGSMGDAKDYEEAYKSEIASPEKGIIILRQNTEDGRRIANDVALSNFPVHARKEINLRIHPGTGNDREIENIPVISTDKGNVDVESKIISTEGSVGDDREAVRAEEAVDDGRKEISTEEIVDDGMKEISAEENVDDSMNDDAGKADTDENTEDTGKDTDTGNFGIREVAGFLIDKDGYITGVTERVDVTDGILIFAWDEGCIGIRKGALSELAGSVGEIYIPVNIREIESGALDEFLQAAYIEVAADHPCYYSEDGVLYSR